MNFVALDVETANADLASICQIGVVRFSNGKVVDQTSHYVDPESFFDPVNVSIHGIDETDVYGAPTFDRVLKDLAGSICGGVVATHTYFDRTAISRNCARYDVPVPECTWLDTTRVARRTWEAVSKKGYGLSNLAEMLGIDFNHHDAGEDARATGMILAAALKESGKSLAEWIELLERPWREYPASIKSMDGNPDGPLFGEVLVFTGELSLPRSEAAEIAAKLGCAVKTGVSKKVTSLVVGDQDVSKLAGHNRSGKHRKALELMRQGHPIRIVRESDFLSMMGLAE